MADKRTNTVKCIINIAMVNWGLKLDKKSTEILILRK